MYKGVDCSSFSILNHDFTFFHIIRINILLEPYDVSEHFYIINLLLFFIKIAPFKLIVLFLSKKKINSFIYDKQFNHLFKWIN